MNERLLLLKAAMERKNMVAVSRDGLGAQDCAGIPVAAAPQLAVLHNDNNFRLDGYAALRPGDITAVERLDEDGSFCRRALQGEGVYAQVRPLPFPAGDWRELIEGVRRAFGGWMAAECEAGEEPLYFLGRALAVDDDYLTLEQVDADGARHAQPDSIPLDELTLVSFGDAYLRVFAKYLK